MKSFKEYVTEATAADLEPNVQKDDETKEMKPQAKGEKDFADMHKGKEDKKHPVAGDHQFDGSREEVKK